MERQSSYIGVRDYFGAAVAHLNIQPSEFWGMTLNEFWAVYDAKFGHVIKPMTRREMEKMEKSIKEAEVKKHGNRT